MTVGVMWLTNIADVTKRMTLFARSTAYCLLQRTVQGWLEGSTAKSKLFRTSTGCVSAQFFHVKRPHPWSHLSSKESAEKHGLASGGPFAKHQDVRLRDLIAQLRRNQVVLWLLDLRAKLSALAQPEKHINSLLSKSSGEIHPSKMQDDVQTISQHADDLHSKAESLIKPSGPAKPVSSPSGPAVPPSSSDSTNKSNGT
ncbi:hypothetical protein RvY_04057 [Ramazzottius varieornatus]|uniref:Uncharacterized protein n=1 Tax=Ramazzottius varieornatus TaxID=947166 RepID=A0A1D1UVW9_RAMVA|nr:hypothetical protein RvY_04057 [Ramazzottius varieornatus]